MWPPECGDSWSPRLTVTMSCRCDHSGRSVEAIAVPRMDRRRSTRRHAADIPQSALARRVVARARRFDSNDRNVVLVSPEAPELSVFVCPSFDVLSMLLLF